MKRAAEMNRAELLAALTAQSQMFGLLGRGFPGSVYKVFVRVDAQSDWYNVSMLEVRRVDDPVVAQRRRLDAGADPVSAVFGTIRLACEFESMDDHIADVATRAREVCAR